MSQHLTAAALLALAVTVLQGCASFGTASEPAAPKAPPSLLGEVDRAQVEAAEPHWVAEQVEVNFDHDAAARLSSVDPAEITVYFGTWCGDSKRELARFWAAADVAGFLPFDVKLIAVDRYDKRPPEMEEELGLRWVPTFVVERDGAEIGRMVEVSPNGIERDLLAILTGQASGIVSAREDLQ